MKRFRKLLLIILVLLVLGVGGAIIFSPYGSHEGFNGKLIENTVEIDAPADSVFAYLGNSANAHNWSVFVDHITTLNSDSFPDGVPGSRRRCFRQADEKGIQWDELITVREPGKRRQLSIYNLKEFSMQADNLLTEQLYTPLGPNKCKLSLTLFFRDGKASWWDTFKTYLAAYKVKSIFSGNMANIKRIIEERYGRKS